MGLVELMRNATKHPAFSRARGGRNGQWREAGISFESGCQIIPKVPLWYFFTTFIPGHATVLFYNYTFSISEERALKKKHFPQKSTLSSF